MSKVFCAILITAPFYDNISNTHDIDVNKKGLGCNIGIVIARIINGNQKLSQVGVNKQHYE